MGKSQKKKAMRTRRRHNPVRVPDTHIPHGLAAASASSASSKAAAVLPIIYKMQSAETAERTWACAAVSNLIQNDPSTRRLLQGRGVVAALITRLTDAAEDVVVEAAGALRNLCIDGGYDICAEMYNKNIMAPLRTFPAKISSALQQLVQDPQSAPDTTQRAICTFAESIITIFWCLSETSNKALRAVSDAHLPPFLMSFLHARMRLPVSTVVAAAQCLYVLSEENDVVISELRRDASAVACLLEIAQSLSSSTSPHEGEEDVRGTMLRVLSCGILRNISPLPAPTRTPIELESGIILPLLAPLLSLDLAALTERVTHLLPTLPDPSERLTNPALAHAPQADHRTPAEREIDAGEERMRVVQLALEILTGVCAVLPDVGVGDGVGVGEGRIEDEIEADVYVERDEDENEDGMEHDADVDAEPTHPDTTPPHTSPHLLSTLTPPLLALSRPTTLSFPHLPSSHPPTTAALGTIHVRALECLNNLFLAAGGEDGGGAGGADVAGVWDGVWGTLCAVGREKEKGTRGKEMWEVGVGVLWGVARRGRGRLVPDEKRVRVLIELCEAAEEEEDVLRAKCVGVLECLAQCRDALEANKTISHYLLTLLTTPTPSRIESCIAAAAGLIDIFTDEAAPYDAHFRATHMGVALARAVPVLWRLVRGVDRRVPGGAEVRARGEEVVMNLEAFVEYRRGLGIGMGI